MATKQAAQETEGKTEGEVVEETVIVEERPAEEKREPTPNPRNARLEAIAKAYRDEIEVDNRKRASDTTPDRDETPAPVDQSDEISRLKEKIEQGAGDEDDAAALAELEAEPDTDTDTKRPVETEATAPAKTENVFVRAVVNGQAFDVPKDEIDDAGGLRAWQTNRAADARLEEAKRILREAETRAAPAAQPVAVQAAPKPDEDIDKLASELATAVTLGTDTDIKDKFKQVLTQVASNQEQARRAASNEVVAAMTRAEVGRTDEVLTTFVAENADLVENTTRQNAFAATVRDLMIEDMKRHGLTDQQAMQANNRQIGQHHAQMRALRSGRPIDVIYKIAADAVRRDLGFTAPARAAEATKTVAAPASMTRRVEQKRAATSATTAGAASARAASPSAPRKPRTHEEIVAEMKKQRQRPTSGAL